MAPTILYYLGVPVPQDMDGKVMDFLFEDFFLRSHGVSYQGGGDDAGDATEQGHYSAEEAEKIRERLANLGYLE